MREGWLRNPKDGWTYRFQRDEKSWLQDPFVFVDKGRAMPDGSPALLKTPSIPAKRSSRGDVEGPNAEGLGKDPCCLGC